MKVETNAVLVEGVNRDGAEVTSTGRSFQCECRRQGRRQSIRAYYHYCAVLA